MPAINAEDRKQNLRRKFRAQLSRFVPSAIAAFGPIDDELAEYAGLLSGKVLNAGAGVRDVAHLISGELVNQDIRWPEEDRENIQIYSPLHQIVAADNTFDAIICIAVLEHVENPDEVTEELFRVLKPGGHLILSVPFLQPEHKVPTDFQRYTEDGLSSLVRRHGFRVISSKPLFTVYHTLYWIVWQWLHCKTNLPYKLGRLIILPLILWASRRSNTVSPVLASAFQVVATKDKVAGVGFLPTCTAQ